MSKKLIKAIIKDIFGQLKSYMESDIDDEICIDLPDSDEYYITEKKYGFVFDFLLELYLIKSDISTYQIDADAPGSIDDDIVRVIIKINPKNYKQYLCEIYFNLIYTLHHEYEHILQVMSDYNRVKHGTRYNYRGDSLSRLLKYIEIEPQVRGYYIQSKKERKPFDLIINTHLDKMISTGQVKFKNNDRKEILVNLLINEARNMRLPIKLKNLQ
jgi:hypothetical protein